MGIGGLGDVQMFPRQTKRTETGLGEVESPILTGGLGCACEVFGWMFLEKRWYD
jgi:hypothetical protein